MANLAIKGHATRGKEVIEILEMLGGALIGKIMGNDQFHGYYINLYGEIDYKHYSYFDDAIQYTLEEFLEKFPYKVGDKVQHKGATSCGTVYVIERMKWANNHTEYEIRPLYNDNHTGLVTVTTEDLQPFKEETMDNAVFDANAQCCDIMNHLIKKETIEGKITKNEDEGTLVAIDLTRDFRKADDIEVILGDYEFVLKDGKTYFVKKNKYPQTYAECCKILNIPANGDIVYAGNWADGGEYLDKHLDIIRNFQKLRICRDAYWKIAGEQMRLGKSWKPDWTISEIKFTIVETAGVVVKSADMCNKHILAFPIEEMRDAFYENFKDLIEECKEFL